MHLTVAKARYNRDINGAPELGLTLLEKYLGVGRNINAQVRERWAGDYYISVLDTALSRTAIRLGEQNIFDLVTLYPNIVLRDALENMLYSIGEKQLSFEAIRNTRVDFALQFGIPVIPNSVNSAQIATNSNQANQSTAQATGTSSSTTDTNTNTGTTTNTAAANSTLSATGTSATTTTTPPSTTPAQAINTPKSVLNRMRLFRPVGNGREKIVDLKIEVMQLNIAKSPIAFCFLLRSLFEISAKVYCTEKNIPTIAGTRGYDRKLIDILTDATNHLTQNGTNQPMLRQLTGALQQLGNPTSILSVTSMNQLVHNPQFSVLPSDVCVLFHIVYPLLQAMN